MDGENLVETVITSSTDPALAKGWIDTELETPFKIESEKGLYVGMTYHQKAAAKIFSLVGSGFENSFFCQLSDDSEWEDMHGEGILSIEATVDGEMSVDYDMGLISAVIDAVSDVENYIINVVASNNGSKNISGFTVGCRYESEEKGVNTHFDYPLSAGEKAEVACMLPKTYDVFTNPVIVSIEGIDDGEDIISDNNVTVAGTPVIKKVLVEEYTTEMCSNCPRVAGYLHQVMEEPEFENKIVAVCHHSGFYTDWLTQPCDEEMIKFFKFEFAPAVSYDRTPLSGGKIVNTPNQADLRRLVNSCYDKGAGCKIGIIPVYNMDTRKLDVNVNVERTSLSISNPTLTIYLTENDIMPIHQSGDTDGTHIHRHVIRDYNSTWGDPITWNGSHFSANYSFEIDPEWKDYDMKVVAVVGNYNEDDNTDCKIDNVEEVSFVQTTSVSTVDREATEIESCYYDMLGNKVRKDYEGLKIKVVRMSDNTVKAIKILNKR